MGKTKISQRRKVFTSKPRKSRKKRGESLEVSLREDVGITEFDPAKQLLDVKLIGQAIVECLIANDPEGVMEIIEGHISCFNKSKFLKEAKVPRSTMYQLLKKKNPTIKTLAKIMYATHHNEN